MVLQYAYALQHQPRVGLNPKYLSSLLITLEMLAGELK
jgi:hypothetical protein